MYALGEIFIIGVPLFLFISGYLSGKKPINKPANWLLNKAKRVLLPYLLVVWSVFAIHEIAKTEEISTLQWLVSSLTLQGLKNYVVWKTDFLSIKYMAVPGTGHYWFVTVIMICYLITPLMQKYRGVSLKTLEKILVTLLAIVVLCISMWLGLQLFYFMMYVAGFFTGLKKIRTDNKYYIIITSLAVLTSLLRMILKAYIDGSDFYDRTFVLINNGMLAIWLFYTMYYIQSKTHSFFSKFAVGFVYFFEKISYFVFLTHYIFLQGAFATTNYISNLPIALCVAIILAFFSAILLWGIIEKLFPFVYNMVKNKLKGNRLRG